ncbi:LysR family transcriptional regulator [Hylemonella sp. W303a]|uniref:LysR family transcriptional regulator n=1 Tax=Hylemonella sp. W303a TaxID=3389873 RepID=UPI00396B3CB3
MSLLEDIDFFVQAGRANSLSEVARRLDVSPAAASASLKRLEAELGTKLMVRSTRNLRLTHDGELFLAQCAQGLELIQSARESLLAGRDIIGGQVQLSLPSDLGRQLVLPWLHAFRQKYPGVHLRLQLSDRLAGIYREHVDVVLRYGEPSDSSLISLPVAPKNRRVLCASPSYVRQHGAPRTPEELRHHACLCFQLSDRIHNRWQFERRGLATTVEVTGPIVSDDGDAVRQLALLGEGIVYKSNLDVAHDLSKGRLVALCTDWRGEPAPLYLACADRSQLRPVVKLLREFLIERLQTLT